MRIAFGSLGVVLLTGAAALLGAVIYIATVAASEPPLDRLKPMDQAATSVVYAADGRSKLGYIGGDQLRTPIAHARIPDVVRQATVAIEDRRFYRHRGVDYTGIVRAALANAVSGKTVQGGSTITMQLVRNLYISKERTFERKIREAKLAEQLENRRSKYWILDQYLNNVPYGTLGGQTAVGIEAAARVFFDKPARSLTLPEAALLAGLPQAPSVYNPFNDRRAALRRRTEVLRHMLAERMITPSQARTAIRSPVGIKRNSFYQFRRSDADYFFDYVKQQLIDRYGMRTVRRGGMKIYTTIDLGMQSEARQAIASRLSYAGAPSAAIVSVDPRTGEIRAMASSGSYGENKFNYAAQAQRQPGSTFKTMVLLAGVRRGVDPRSTTYNSRPLAAGWLPSNPGYSVSTFSHTYSGRINLVQATLKSDNSVYAQLDADLGPQAVRQTAYDMGITSRLDAYPAEGLGGLTHGVSPLEMASAYATLASGGLRNRPTAIDRVVFPGGRVERLGQRRPVRAFSDGVTDAVTKVLEENIRSGTGRNAGLGCPAAGKTGTTNDFKDAWFVGYTPRLSTAVWVGHPQPRPMYGMQGGGTPASIWHDFMSAARGSFCGDFPAPTQPASLSSFSGRYASAGGSYRDSRGASGTSANGSVGRSGSVRSYGGATRSYGGAAGAYGGAAGGASGGASPSPAPAPPSPSVGDAPGGGFDPRSYGTGASPAPAPAGGGVSGTGVGTAGR